ncbi:glutamine-synthetase adenylyltransferase [Rhodophyticola sp. CCM32]|uniref:[protein-PII] uridylyltransferase family protein n=1 Tax=Rhodophyticola sp. CCM32 TaxID=2916397 RepID=UPI00107F71C5|nr:glutamine-synthetase adenylyltransferase [Rhodophyticola sp. CCM32]QBY00552.1 glutamine-synthetase adenylyltransferase [Rhodophyticola sp. CCM32]
MSFATRLTRHPIAYDPDRGAEALAGFPDLAPELRPLIEGSAGCSPYLARLMVQEAEWLTGMLAGTPETAQAGIVAQTQALDGPGLNSGLRQAKRRVALLTALADLGGIWSLEEVTGALTGFADAAVQAALQAHIGTEISRGKLPGMTGEDAAKGAGMVVLAMGKMGAGELNYSSDIDLICLFDETRFDPADEMEARAGFVRATRRITASLSENTAEGYVFRTDLRLRPDASVTPVCISMAAAERYYEAEGRSWERGAYIKARPAAGDIAAGVRFLTTLVPFVWRKHLDFAAIQDTHDMRQRIRSHKRLHGPIALDGHNMKLGPGGIREIEFFAQTRQLVAGGRDPDLRSRETVTALADLAAKGWIGEDVAKDLTGHYRQHREVEHRLQMIADAQTHDLPNTPEGFDRLARFCGAGDTGAFREGLTARLIAVDGLTEPFFTPESRPEVVVELSEAARAIVDRWPGYPALRSARGQEIFAQLKPDLLARFQRAARPDEALGNFDGFLRGLPAGVQLFSLFKANPPLVDLLVDICATAPALARYLSRQSGVLDAVLGGSFFEDWPSQEDLASDLAAQLDGLDYEAQLDAARRWQKEWHFRIGVHHLRGLIDAERAGAQYSALADAVIAALWPVVCADLARRHGPAPGRGGAVLAMGSLGAGRLSAGSDLDLIVIYDAAGVEMTEGRRPLNPRAWFAKATKALITALGAPTAEGKLYEVDMRLRPSGRQGPVASGLAAFRQYQMKEAWIWEHMALTRARPVAGAPDLLADIEAVRRDVLARHPAPGRVLADMAQMRGRVQAAGRAPATGALAVKDGPGGGQDIELLAQAAALCAGDPARDVAGQIAAMPRIGWLTAEEAQSLTATHQLFASLQQATRLLTDRDLDLDEIGMGGCAFLCRAAGVQNIETLTAALDAARAEAARMIGAVLAQEADAPSEEE